MSTLPFSAPVPPVPSSPSKNRNFFLIIVVQTYTTESMWCCFYVFVLKADLLGWDNFSQHLYLRRTDSSALSK